MKTMQGNRSIALCIPILGVLALGACASAKKVDEAATTNPAISELNRNLQEQYVALATSERSQGDKTSARHFSAKAKEASSGTAVGPDDIAARNAARRFRVTGEPEKELADARSRLLANLNDPVAAKNPAAAAKAQTSFDCWLEQQQEGWQHDDIAACRKGFETAMGQLDAAKVAAVPPPKETSPVERLVHFEFDSDQLIPSSQDKMAELLREAELSKPTSVQIISFTDLSGPKDHNMKLAEMRGQRLKEKLREATGAEVIKVDARGPVDPIVNTPEPNQENRRAVIIMN